jgi:hypothetical protein
MDLWFIYIYIYNYIYTIPSPVHIHPAETMVDVGNQDDETRYFATTTSPCDVTGMLVNARGNYPCLALIQ